MAVAYLRAGPTSSTWISVAVRFSPSRVSYERCFRRPWTTTRMPRCRDSATFSAAWRQTEQAMLRSAMGELKTATRPDEVAAWLPGEVEKWAAVIKAAGAKPE